MIIFIVAVSRYHFRILDSFGWNFRHAHFHEEGRRTLYKAFGIKFVIIVQGRAGKERQRDSRIYWGNWDDAGELRRNNKEIEIIPTSQSEKRVSQSVIRFSYFGSSGKFDLKNTVINIVAGLGLLSFITMFCDFVLLHYVKERKIVSQRKQNN